MIRMQHYDRIGVKFDRSTMREVVGGARVVDGIGAHVGNMTYHDDQGRPFVEHVPAATLFAPASLASAEGTSTTIRHPAGLVTADNYQDETHGTWLKAWDAGSGNLGVRLRLGSAAAIKMVDDAIAAGEPVELSPAYEVDVDATPGQTEHGRHDGVQRDRVYNAIAILGPDEARGGPGMKLALDGPERAPEGTRIQVRSPRLDSDDADGSDAFVEQEGDRFWVVQGNNGRRLKSFGSRGEADDEVARLHAKNKPGSGNRGGNARQKVRAQRRQESGLDSGPGAVLPFATKSSATMKQETISIKGKRKTISADMAAILRGMKFDASLSDAIETTTVTLQKEGEEPDVLTLPDAMVAQLFEGLGISPGAATEPAPELEEEVAMEMADADEGADAKLDARIARIVAEQVKLHGDARDKLEARRASVHSDAARVLPPGYSFEGTDWRQWCLDGVARVAPELETEARKHYDAAKAGDAEAGGQLRQMLSSVARAASNGDGKGLQFTEGKTDKTDSAPPWASDSPPPLKD